MQRLGREDGAHTSVFLVLRKRRQRGESHEGVLEVTVWVCRDGGACGGYA